MRKLITYIADGVCSKFSLPYFKHRIHADWVHVEIAPAHFSDYVPYKTEVKDLTVELDQVPTKNSEVNIYIKTPTFKEFFSINHYAITLDAISDYLEEYVHVR